MVYFRLACQKRREFLLASYCPRPHFFSGLAENIGSFAISTAFCCLFFYEHLPFQSNIFGISVCDILSGIILRNVVPSRKCVKGYEVSISHTIVCVSIYSTHFADTLYVNIKDPYICRNSFHQLKTISYGSFRLTYLTP